MMREISIALFAALAAACVSFPDTPQPSASPVLANDEKLVSFDGARLALQQWKADDPMAVIVAVHGMNDYSETFAMAAPWWRDRGVTTIAYDQRGFGGSPDFGRWVGAETMKADLRAAIAAVRAEYPGLPLFVAGHSMGAAIVLSANADERLDADGLVLAAPGIWGGANMSLFLRASANMAAVFAPGKTLTGERAERQATDNIDVLKKMWADPKVIKATRVDAVVGVLRAMGEGWDATDETAGDILFLIGEKDEIIPVDKQAKAAARLCGKVRVIRYVDGWHMLFRDLQAENVWRDVLSWIENWAEAKEPSQAAEQIACDGS